MRVGLIWPLVFVVTVVLYILIILCLPWNQLYSTLFLFALIGFWSRLPGVAIPTPMYILYFADIIDFLSVIICINVDARAGAMFSLTLNIVSRMCGQWPRWDGVIKDSFCQFFACLCVPYVHPLFGYDFNATITVYTVLRCLFFIPTRIIPDGTNWIEFWVYEMAAASFAMIVVNLFYSNYFGWLFNSIMLHGTNFNWILFAVVSLIIFAIKRHLFGKTELPAIRLRLKQLLGAFGSKRLWTNHMEMMGEIEMEEMLEIKGRILG